MSYMTGSRKTPLQKLPDSGSETKDSVIDGGSDLEITLEMAGVTEQNQSVFVRLSGSVVDRKGDGDDHGIQLSE
jgi:hypothetical protein